MTQFTPKKSFVIFVCLFLTINITLSQVALYEIPLNDQVEQSTQIIEGEVISKTSFWNASQTKIYTSFRISVSKVFKGNLNPYVDIVVDGGVIDLNAQIVSHSLQLRNGEFGTFLLKDNVNHTNTSNIPKFSVVSDIQGFYNYNLESDKVVNTFSVRDGIIDNFYNEIITKTGQNFTELRAVNLETSILNNNSNNRSLTASLTTLEANQNTAGTKSVLTIKGLNFGSSPGTVQFSNANYGGYIYFDVLESQILSWTDTQIEVEIPHLAGTGKVKINTLSNGTIESDDNFIIDYAEINLETNIGNGNEAFQTQHIDKNSSGGYTWIMNQDFNANQDAVDAFTRAFENWTCSSGVNWLINTDDTTLTNSAQQDSENVITFDSTLSSGVLGRSTSYYQGCLEGTEVKWYVSEIDIVFNPNKIWNFSTNAPLYNETDFESVTVHELGHAHQLGHVVDSNEVMHYSLSNGVSKRELSENDLSGATDIHLRSTENPVCFQELMTNSTCYELSLNVAEVDILKNDIKVYPNPNNGQFYINNSANLEINNIKVYNIIGELVLSYSDINLIHDKLQLSIRDKGLYIIQLDSNNASISKKLIIH